MFYCIFDQIYAASNKDHKLVVCCRVCFITYNSNVCYTILNIDTFLSSWAESSAYKILFSLTKMICPLG